MLFGVAKEEVPGFLHTHSVSVEVVVKDKCYRVTVEESWTKPDHTGLGLERFQKPRKVVIEFATVVDFLHEARSAFWDDDECRAELQGFDRNLLEDAMRDAYDQISDILIFNGAAHLEDPAELVIDWDEAKCRRLIKKVADN